MVKYVKWIVLEVGAGILLTGIIGTLMLGISTGFVSRETVGFMVGIIAAVLLFYSMGVSVETSVELGDVAAARRYAKKMYGLRTAAIIIGTLVAAKLNWFSILTALLALFSIKVGMYLQPITHKLFCRWFHLKDELSPDALYLPEEEEELSEDGEPMGYIDRWMEKRYGKK